VAAREGLSQTTFYLAHDFLGEPLFLRLATNSYSMASTAIGVQRYMKLFAYLPAALHPRIERALLICFGVGMTASALTDLPDLRSLEVVDVSRDILDMSDVVHADRARHPLRDPRVRTHVEDGRFFLQTTTARNDLITGEPPPPKMAGVASLYTREYFELVKERLNPGGIATYWLPAYLLLEDEALRSSGPSARRSRTARSGRAPPRLDPRRQPRRDRAGHARALLAAMGARAAGSELRRIGVDSPPSSPRSSWPTPTRCASSPRALLRLSTTSRGGSAPRSTRRSRATRYGSWTRPRIAGGSRPALAGILPLRSSPKPGGLSPPRDPRPGAPPELRGADYNAWSDVAFLLTRTELIELPRWILGSGAQAAAIAARRGASDPIAAEHLAIDALARRRPPPHVDQGALRRDDAPSPGRDDVPSLPARRSGKAADRLDAASRCRAPRLGCRGCPPPD
jgi:hypothetical protein